MQANFSYFIRFSRPRRQVETSIASVTTLPFSCRMLLPRRVIYTKLHINLIFTVYLEEKLFCLQIYNKHIDNIFLIIFTNLQYIHIHIIC